MKVRISYYRFNIIQGKDASRMKEHQKSRPEGRLLMDIVDYQLRV